MQPYKCVLPYIHPVLRKVLEAEDLSKAEEIRLTINKPLVIVSCGIIKALDVIVNKEMFEGTIQLVCKGSVYAAQDRLKAGFITINGGNRIGVCGRVIVKNGEITHMADISSLCFRLAREIIGAADKIMPYIMNKNRVFNTLIVSPPSCGKTTILRDIARQIGDKKRVGIVDERSEIASTVNGIAQNDVGVFTTVLDACPKDKGIMLMLRSMSPEVIITDEIGTNDDEEAIFSIMNAGVKIICSAHGYSIKDLKRRKSIGTLLNNKIFEKIVILSGRNGSGTIEDIVENVY